MTTKKYLILFITALLICSAVIFFVRNHRSQKPTDRVYIHVVPFEKPDGWGYDILTDDKVYIHQDYIPVITGYHRFKTREDALRTGKRVVEKISGNQSPALTREDLEELGITKK